MIYYLTWVGWGHLVPTGLSLFRALPWSLAGNHLRDLKQRLHRGECQHWQLVGGLRKMVGVAWEKKVGSKVAEAVACFESPAVGPAGGAEKRRLKRCLSEVRRQHR